MCSHLGQRHMLHSNTKCWKIGPKGCKLALMVSFFSASGPIQGPIQGHKVQHSLITWGRLKILFSISAMTPSVKPVGLISTFAPIGMLDLSSTLALTPSVKWA